MICAEPGLSPDYMSLRSLLQRLFESEDTANLRERLEEVEIRFKRLEEEWTEVYNKFRTLQMRVAKQVQRLDANSSTEEPQGAGSEITTELMTPVATTLSPRQRELQKQIMTRRKAAGGGE